MGMRPVPPPLTAALAARPWSSWHFTSGSICRRPGLAAGPHLRGAGRIRQARPPSTDDDVSIVWDGGATNAEEKLVARLKEIGRRRRRAPPPRGFPSGQDRREELRSGRFPRTTWVVPVRAVTCPSGGAEGRRGHPRSRRSILPGTWRCPQAPFVETSRPSLLDGARRSSTALRSRRSRQYAPR